MNILITGTSKPQGLGMAAAKKFAAEGHTVILNTRTEKAAAECIAALAPLMKTTPTCLIFDTRDTDKVKSEIARAIAQYGRIDVLINNAGAFLDGHDATTLNASPEKITENFQINTIGTLNVIQAVLPQMIKQKFGRIVNVSSGMGQLSEMNGGYHGYRLSKTALNALTRIVADENSDDNIQVNSMCPGWCKTEMGGEGAERSPEEGADTMVWLGLQPDGGPTGKFFRDREEIEW